jgi:hypothetical protein
MQAQAGTVMVPAAWQHISHEGHLAAAGALWY